MEYIVLCLRGINNSTIVCGFFKIKSRSPKTQSRSLLIVNLSFEFSALSRHHQLSSNVCISFTFHKTNWNMILIFHLVFVASVSTLIKASLKWSYFCFMFIEHEYNHLPYMAANCRKLIKSPSHAITKVKVKPKQIDFSSLELYCAILFASTCLSIIGEYFGRRRI